nr:HD domain-containing phosphohydrolase [Aliikangiella sp. G2MR2-5]
MIVDDNQSNLKLVEKVLRRSNYKDLVLIDDPREVVDTYRANRPELILLDINMPYLNGFEVLKRLNALNDDLLPPVVILTAQNSQDTLFQALELGARDYISKPFDTNELLMRVKNLLDAQLAHHFLHDQKALLEQLVQERTKELEDTRLQVVQRLGKAAEYRDEETGNHILRMSHSCALLAEALGWNEKDCKLILNASPMHDIGKIGIPDHILLKPGRFEPDEWEIMKTHAQIGAQLLDGDDSELLVMAREIALTHHEKWDGSGYPNGTRGEEIPEAGRIAALADVFDALTSERPYKKAWPIEQAIEFIQTNKGSHFEPRVVETFLNILPGILEIRSRFSD